MKAFSKRSCILGYFSHLSVGLIIIYLCSPKYGRQYFNKLVFGMIGVSKAFVSSCKFKVEYFLPTMHGRHTCHYLIYR